MSDREEQIERLKLLIADEVRRERERCIAAMVASQREGFNDPGAEAYYRKILEAGK